MAIRAEKYFNLHKKTAKYFYFFLLVKFHAISKFILLMRLQPLNMLGNRY